MPIMRYSSLMNEQTIQAGTRVVFDNLVMERVAGVVNQVYTNLSDQTVLSITGDDGLLYHAVPVEWAEVEQ